MKKLIVLLKIILSCAVIFSVYFIFARLDTLIVLYIYAGLIVVLAVAYAVMAFKLRSVIEDDPNRGEGNETVAKYRKIIKNIVIILAPMILAILSDYMIIKYIYKE